MKPDTLFDMLADKLTLFFIFGDKDSFESYKKYFDEAFEFIETKEKINEMNEEAEKYGVKTFPDLVHCYFRYNRGSFEKEQEAVKRALQNYCQIKKK